MTNFRVKRILKVVIKHTMELYIRSFFRAAQKRINDQIIDNLRAELNEAIHIYKIWKFNSVYPQSLLSFDRVTVDR